MSSIENILECSTTFRKIFTVCPTRSAWSLSCLPGSSQSSSLLSRATSSIRGGSFSFTLSLLFSVAKYILIISALLALLIEEWRYCYAWRRHDLHLPDFDLERPRALTIRGCDVITWMLGKIRQPKLQGIEHTILAPHVQRPTFLPGSCCDIQLGELTFLLYHRRGEHWFGDLRMFRLRPVTCSVIQGQADRLLSNCGHLLCDEYKLQLW